MTLSSETMRQFLRQDNRSVLGSSTIYSILWSNQCCKVLVFLVVNTSSPLFVLSWPKLRVLCCKNNHKLSYHNSLTITLSMQPGHSSPKRIFFTFCAEALSWGPYRRVWFSWNFAENSIIIGWNSLFQIGLKTYPKNIPFYCQFWIRVFSKTFRWKSAISTLNPRFFIDQVQF